MKKRNRFVIKHLWIILVAIALLIGGVYAWFTSEQTVEDDIQTGTVAIAVSGETEGDVMTFAADGALPGDMLYEGGKIEIENTGTADVYLRVRIAETWSNGEGEIAASTNRALDGIMWGKYNMNDDWQEWTGVGGASAWQYHDGYYYYIVLDDDVQAFVPGSENIITFLPGDIKIRLSEDAGNAYQGATYRLALTFEAAQYENLAGSTEILTASALAGIWPVAE